MASFTFEGNDELDPVHGYGKAVLADENTLDGYMRYHQGDADRFTWKRISDRKVQNDAVIAQGIDVRKIPVA